MISASPSPNRDRRGGYTLLELLLAITIALVMLALVVAAVRSIQENLHLTRAGQLLVDQIGMARQLATTRNWTVYVYLYKVSATSSVGYTAVQLWRSAPPAGSGAPAVMLTVDKAVFLPSSVVISEDATHNSTLLNVLAQQTGGTPPLPNLPPTLANATYVAFAIKSTGMLLPAVAATDTTGAPSPAAGSLAASCLTVVPARMGAQTVTPANFISVQINPYTGTCAVYRP